MITSTALAASSSVTLTVAAGDSLMIDSGRTGSAIVEAVTGVPGTANKRRLVAHPGGQATYGPFGAGTVKLSAIGGAIAYLVGVAPLSDNGGPAVFTDSTGAALTGPDGLTSVWIAGGATPITVSRTLTNDDNGATLYSASASAIILTVPTALVAGFNCTAFQGFSGGVLFAAADGVTVANESATTLGANTSIGLINTGTNSYDVLSPMGQALVVSTVAAPGVSLTTGTAANVTSISLLAGKWLVDWAVDFAMTGTTSTLSQSAASLDTAALPTQLGGSGLGTDPLVSVPFGTTTITGTYVQNGRVSLDLGATTTVYLVASQTFSAGATTAYGTIRAKRI